MIDHVLLEVIGTIRRCFAAALLERQAVEERFQVDVFLGDLSWETSYSLPGEGTPPRVRADLSLDWPTWSQSAYRSWSIGEPPDDLPELVVEIALRIQRLSALPDPEAVVAVLPEESPVIGTDTLERSGPTLEQSWESGGGPSPCAVEVSYEGTYRLDETILEDPANIEERIAALARWVASTLVRLGDLGLAFLPPEEQSERS